MATIVFFVFTIIAGLLPIFLIAGGNRGLKWKSINISLNIPTKKGSKLKLKEKKF